jgi:hypothetical protein
MNRDYPTNSVFIQVQSERQVDLLSNAGTTVSWIALLHFHDGIDDFFTGSFGTGLPATTGRIQLPVFPLLHCVMK